MTIKTVCNNKKIERLPKKMFEFSKSVKMCQPDKDKPILVGWFRKEHKKWLSESSEEIEFEEIYVTSSRWMKSSKWNGYVSQLTFPSIDSLMMFVLTFR